MYKKILSPLDGSKLSEIALSHLKAVALGCHVPEVVLLTVVQPFNQVSEGVYNENIVVKEGREKAVNDANSYLGDISKELQKEGIHTSIVVLEGNAADSILKYIKANKIDLVVMSTHGRSGISQWTMGSVVDKIVRHSIAAVLTVAPAGYRD